MKITNEELLRKMQACEHEHYHYKKTVEMDWEHAPQRPTVNHKNSDALDPRWQKEERKTTNVVEKNSRK